jgi:hypothetical protein
MADPQRHLARRPRKLTIERNIQMPRHNHPHRLQIDPEASHGQRGIIRTRSPSADQVVLVLRDPVSPDPSGADAISEVDTAVAFNWRLAEHQSAILGFEPPPPLEGHCEILAMFSRRDADLTGLRDFMRTAAQQALEMGLKTADATCTDRLLPAYRHFGGQTLDACSIEGERRTRLRFNLEALARLERLT